ncbi:Hsp70 protein-domain-containing protein [Gautieria morchelliformis]|nr:Hsp70 protein-domain-containing protein [Gautieria morchelliformis]
MPGSPRLFTYSSGVCVFAAQSSHRCSELRGALQREVTKAKRTLSSQASTKLEIKSFESDDEACRTGLKDANVKKENINDIILVGGSTHIPNVQQLLKQFFGGKEPSRSNEAVAYGVPIQGGGSVIWRGGNWRHRAHDVCPLTLAIETTGGVFMKLIPPNTVVPTKQSQIFVYS